MAKMKFGYKDIDELDKPEEVNNVFTSVSNSYDVMNDIMSFGLHRLWKKQFIRLCNIKSQKKVLDIACGTGDIALELIRKNPSIELTCLDPNIDMIEICKEKFINKGIINVDYQVKGIEDYNSRNKKFDLVTVTFGFRNFTNHEIALQNIIQILEPGGLFLIMDFKKPRNQLYAKLFKFYTLNIIPSIGKIIAKDESSYRYLGESIQTYYSPDEIRDMLFKAGFSKIELVNLPEDVASIHIGRKA
jgi:demethylmenaquinone methyltransferase/2-methoxy-6-polyprenyl-1,4-benzoquinol methylase